jgi:hypothetical protein
LFIINSKVRRHEIVVRRKSYNTGAADCKLSRRALAGIFKRTGGKGRTVRDNSAGGCSESLTHTMKTRLLPEDRLVLTPRRARGEA